MNDGLIMPDWKLSPASPPFAFYRNLSQHQYKKNITTNTAAEIESSVWKQVLYYQTKLSEHPIPSYLLYDFLVQDCMKNNSQTKICSTVANCHHMKNTYVVHAAGADLKEIIIRSPSTFEPFQNTRVHGFVHLVGCEIDQIETCGTSNWNSVSHLLVRSGSEVHHLRTALIQDYESKFSDRISSPIDIILEPIQKWIIPSTVVSLATMKSSVSHASILIKSFHLYVWDPLGGLRQPSTNKIFPSQILDELESHNGRWKSNSILEYSTAPHTLWCAARTHVLAYDHRSASTQELYSSNQNILAMLQHPKEGNLLCIKTPPSLCLLDTRHTKQVLSEINMPSLSDGNGGTHLSFTAGEALGSPDTGTI